LPDLGGIAVAGLAGGLAALAYVTGAVVLTYRYDGFGLPGQQLVSVTPREQLLVRGGVALVLWGAIAVALFGAVKVLARLIRHTGRRASLAASTAAFVAVTLSLILVLHVFWPLWAMASVLLYFVFEALLPDRILARAVVCVIAIAAAAVSYEMSRLTYGVEWSTATVEHPAQDVSGVLIGQSDRGIYLGVPRGRSEGRLTVVFLPERRVLRLESEPRSYHVDRPSARARREPIRERIWHAIP
jgi:hypothetical protein